MGVPESLARLELILERYGYAHQAEYVSRLRLLYMEDRDRFRDELDDRVMWGGAGSVADSAPLGGSYRDRIRAETDQAQFFRELARLVDELDAVGLATARALELGQAFHSITGRHPDESPKAIATSLLGRLQKPPGYQLPGGVDEEAARGFQRRMGLSMPFELIEWLRVCNGALVGPGGTYGIETRERWLDIEAILASYPAWRARGWIPAAGDGTGNHYVLATDASAEPSGAALFVDTGISSEAPAYVAASDIWHLLIGLFTRELGKSQWPFDREATLAADPGLARLASLRLPWDE
jgi:cell wall assembly regulator SMI1